MSAVRPALVCLVAAAAFGVACGTLVGIEDSPPAPASGGSGGDAAVGGGSGVGGTAGGAGAAGSGGSAGADSGVDAGCATAHPPTATAGADPGGDVDFVVAIRKVDMGDAEAGGEPTWKSIGYDLDELCTCESDTSGSCKAPKKVVCDGLAGRDNALGAFLHQIRTVFKVTDLSSENLSSRIDAGGNTVLIRVRGYSGTANDAQVEVNWYASDDFDVTNTAPPKWDGSDVWPVLDSSLVKKTAADGGAAYDVDGAKYLDKAAYVANGTLVANLPQGSFSLTASTSINFTAAIFTAKITSGSGWTLENGVLAGITKVSDVLGILPSVDDPFSGNPICTDNLLYAGIKSMICDYPDMSILGSPATPCDYVSLGVSVSGAPAKLGTVIVKPAKPNPCPAGKNPAEDGCSP